MDQCLVVGLHVLGAKVAPVATCVSSNKHQGVDTEPIHDSQRGRRGDEVAQGKQDADEPKRWL